ncbi:MAG: hypothetical protein H8D95_00220 [Candidatus Endolissoclinum sp.]|nr:hypothetical protein [Candidatus Endolissoclinum sp.]
MKISALLQERANYDAQLIGDINAYLISLKANDIPSVSMDMMVRELTGMGYTVSPESMVDLLANSKLITKVTTDTIELDNRYSNNDKADKDSVRKLAVKTAKNKVKK